VAFDLTPATAAAAWHRTFGELAARYCDLVRGLAAPLNVIDGLCEIAFLSAAEPTGPADPYCERRVAARYGRSLTLEFGTAGASRRAGAAVDRLIPCLRDDFDRLVAPQNQGIQHRDFKQLLLWAHYPRYVFNSDRLRECFTSHLVPTQLVSDPGRPVITVPDSLIGFGLP
jgi:hypothetical protein